MSSSGKPFPFKAAALVAAAGLVLAACSSNDKQGASEEPTTPATSGSSSAPAPAPAGEAIKVGVLTTCGGPFASFEAESFSGAKYALVKFAGAKAEGENPQDKVSGATVAGKSIEVSYGCSDATPDKAVAEARRLVENVGVKILLGPLSGDEGVAVANYAKSVPGVTFINGTSGAQSTTLAVKAPNFYRFGGDGAQWMAGLGTYAFKTLGWKKVAILGEDYSYPHTLAAGFISEFCSLGGNITARSWVPLSQTDWSSPVAKLPRDVDGVLLLTGGTNTVAAEKAFIQIGRKPGKQMIGGSSVMDPTSFTVGDALVGLTGGSPVPLGGTTAEWKAYTDGMSATFPKVPYNSLFAALYYNGMQTIVEGLTAVNGDISDDGAKLREWLNTAKPVYPSGSVVLDENRNSVQPAYVVQITKDGGQLGFKVMQEIQNVDQTFGGAFSATSEAPGRNSPACTAGNPPPWAK